MKKFLNFLCFFIFVGCSISPFKETSEDRAALWAQNKYCDIYQEDHSQMVKAVKNALKNTGQTMEQEWTEEKITTINTKNLKITLNSSDDVSILIIRVNLLKNKNLVEDLIKEIEKEINCIEYDEKGRPI